MLAHTNMGVRVQDQNSEVFVATIEGAYGD